MANRDILADQDRIPCCRVEDSVVLDVRAVSNDDAIPVCPDHSAKPDTGPPTDGNIAKYGSIGRNKSPFTPRAIHTHNNIGRLLSSTMKVMVGGTFDPLHDGHKRLISRSFELAGPGGAVTIGLTTDQFARRKSHPVREYSIRRAMLERYIRGHGFPAGYQIEPLHDQYGSALAEDFDALVVSEETLPIAHEINVLRKRSGRPKVDIHQVTCVLAEDGEWISSTRIYRGEIDEHGRILPQDAPP